MGAFMCDGKCSKCHYVDRILLTKLLQQLWVNYVASAPLQNATHQLRFPLVLSLIFMVIAFVIELARVFMPYFQNDQKKWAAHDKANLQVEEQDGTEISINSDSARYNPESVEHVDGRVELKV